ncbi:MAG TPA: hypothetical protein VE195_04860, partial [Acidobacteriaceae bacterium]|nr:hypothetical protein [Acidobacteriaceae bacterium]
PGWACVHYAIPFRGKQHIVSPVAAGRGGAAGATSTRAPSVATHDTPGECADFFSPLAVTLRRRNWL